MAQTISRIRVRPAKDEWGVYDPEQAGLAALYARLDKKDAAKKDAAKAAAKPAEPQAADKKTPAEPPTNRNK
jgi:hypothetical protein